MEKILNYRLTLDEWGITNHGCIKDVLSHELQLSRHEISRLKFEGKILVNGQKVHTNDFMHVGDVLTVVFPEEDNGDAVLKVEEPQILLEEDDFIVVNKPDGIPVHPGHGHLEDSLGTIVQSHYLKQDQYFTIRPIGRLDKDVTGAQLYAKNQPAAARLSQQRQNGEMKKGYIALVLGRMAEKQGVIDTAIRREEGQRARVVAEDGSNALTLWKRIQTMQYQDTVYSVLYVEIRTGRTHQIRTHMASIGHPLVGDELYGGKVPFFMRPALHAEVLSFFSPFSRKPIRVRAPLPDDLQKLLKNSTVLDGKEAPALKEETKKEASVLQKPAPEKNVERAESEVPYLPEEKKRKSHLPLILLLIASVILAVLAGRKLPETEKAADMETAEETAIASADVQKQTEEELTISFKPETELVFGSDFDPDVYIVSHTGNLKTEGTVDTRMPGRQTVHYILSSNDGKSRKDIPHTFTVLDPQKPVITLLQETVTIQDGDAYDPLTNIATVTDADGNELTCAQTLVPGTWTIESIREADQDQWTVTIHAMDENSVQADAAFEVKVQRAVQEPSVSADAEDTVPPIIALNQNEVEIAAGDSYAYESNVSLVSDETDGTLVFSDTLSPGTWTIRSADADLNTPGSYTIGITAMDRNGNTADASYVLKVNAKPDPAVSQQSVSSTASSEWTQAGGTEQQIQSFLMNNMGLNRAQAIGIMANIRRESSYNPQADSGIGYYGLCQWGNDRLENLKNFCYANGYDYTSLDGQLNFLAYEMPLSYPNTTAQLRACSDTAEGAGEAAWIFCKGYEVGAEGTAEASRSMAQDMY